jgi:meso-butanediol dehydrogenase / (S,S)-butanediol dehydrogenase / diacetyl reductase
MVTGFVGIDTSCMTLVVDDLAGWVVGVIADTAFKQVKTRLLGSDEGRALKQAAAAAVRRTVMDFCPTEGQRAGELAAMVNRAFVNVHGFVNCAQASARAMIAAGIPGKILGASSISGRQGYAFMGHYTATKFAIIGLVQTAAKELARYGITVNAYVPGMVETDMATTIGDGIGGIFGIPASAAIEEFVKTITLGRMQRPEEVAGLVAYLASADADYMTGQAVAIDGGITFV